MKLKMCIQCGQQKDISMYRKYYNRKSGEYTRCTDCEKLNNRYKYLKKKFDASGDSKVATEIATIENVFERLTKVGLNPPKLYVNAVSTESPIVPTVVSRLENKLQALGMGDTLVPFELGKWLVEDLTISPDEYMSIYDNLVDKYRPFIGTDAYGEAKYDEVFKPVLKAIIDRFYDYEDQFYSEEDDSNGL